MDNTASYDVCIVGAGPVGMFLASKLKLQGVSVAIIERQKERYPLPRAVAFDHEARRNMVSIGLTDELEDILEHVEAAETSFAWRDKNLDIIVDLAWSSKNPRSGFPFAASFSQPYLEALLEKRLLELQVPIIRGMKLESLQQDSSFVHSVITPSQPTANKSLENPLPFTTIKSSFLVGCDGTNSTVRQLVPFTSTDLGFESKWVIADLLLAKNYKPGLPEKLGCAQICDPERPKTIAWSGKGRKRMEFMVLPGELESDVLAEDFLWENLAPWGFNKNNCSLERKVVYQFRAKWANEGSQGRVLLAGDALHQMPPFIGQGLNSGLRDASALGWRIPLALSGASHECLFKSYENERLQHVITLTNHCVQLGEVVCELSESKADHIHKILRANPPPDAFDPPLGKPGILTSQDEAGCLSLQRPIWRAKEKDSILFDKLFGSGWVIISLAQENVEDNLEPDLLDYFTGELQGKIIRLTREQDRDGLYHEWFAGKMAGSNVVLVRPDFYVFGHSRVEDVSGLVAQLKSKLNVAL
ncbi:FAD/NAD(P)-binding domain-containing protein [Meredithblackwellia eburnea MCA 4105]